MLFRSLWYCKTSAYQPWGLMYKTYWRACGFSSLGCFFLLVGFIFRYRTGKDAYEPFLVWNKCAKIEKPLSHFQLLLKKNKTVSLYEWNEHKNIYIRGLNISQWMIVQLATNVPIMKYIIRPLEWVKKDWLQRKDSLNGLNYVYLCLWYFIT